MIATNRLPVGVLATLLIPFLWLPQARTDGPVPRWDDLEAFSRELRVVAKAAQAELDQIPRASFDPAAVVAEVGGRVDDLHAYVAERTRWAPYEGRLRGPVGVLMDGWGSNLDRALLLDALLRAAGHDSRLARGTLDGERAGAVAAAGLQAAAREIATQERNPEDQAAGLAATAARVGLSVAEAEARRDAARGVAEHLVEDAVQWTSSQARRLAAAVDVADAPADDPREAANREALRGEATAAMKDLWWVQVRAGDSWRDLGLLPAGHSLRELDVTAKATVSADALDEELGHRVTVRVVAERHDGKALSSAIAVEHVLPTDQAIGASVSLAFQPLTQSVVPESVDGDAGALRALALKETEWLPVLKFAGEPIYKGSIRTDGTVNPRPAKIATQRKLERGIGALARIGDAKEESSECTAVWIEFVTTGPGIEPRTVRRQVFDLLGPARRQAGNGGSLGKSGIDDDARLRRGLGFCGGHEVLINPCRLSSPFITHSLLDALVGNWQGMLGLVWSAAEGDGRGAARLAGEMAAPPGDLFAFETLRHHSGRFQARQFISQANIVAVHEFVEPGEARPRSGRAFDIVANPIGVLPADAVAMRRVRLEQGVLDTVVEHLLARDDRPDNAAHLFDATRAVGIEWRSTTRVDELDGAGEGLSADLVARLREDVRDGHVVCAPERALVCDGESFAAWWRVDPETGAALGLGDRGWGQGGTEYGELTTTEVKTVLPSSKIYGAGLVCVAVFFTLKIAVGLAVGSLLGPGANPALIAKILDDLIDKYDEMFIRKCASMMIGAPI